MELASSFKRLARRYPGLPVGLLGGLLLVYDFQFVLGKPMVHPVDALVAVVIAVLSMSMVFGGIEIGARGRSAIEGSQIFAFTLFSGLMGFLVAGMLIAYQLVHGVPVVDIWLLVISAGATTAALGVWLAIYYFELEEKATKLYEHQSRVSSLNKRLTILQRVLRHNLRNEMAIIRGHTETLLEGPTSDAQEHSLEVIFEHSKILESLSDNAHRLRQVWNQEATVETDAVEVVRDAVEALEEAHPTADVETHLPESAPIDAHPQFRLAVEEALTNAITHNDPETVDVEVVVERLDGGDVEIRVLDTGSGIPAFELETLQQAQELPLKHGTGLGLWLIYWLVEKSGGELEYESNAPRGTTVRMRLPGVHRPVESTDAFDAPEVHHPPRRGS